MAFPLCRALLFITLLLSWQHTLHAQAYRRDSAFASNGVAMPTGYSYPRPMHYLKKILTQQDGKILLIGTIMGDAPVEIVRLNTNGSVDASFGQGGYYKKDMAPSQAYSYADAALSPTGQILILGNITRSGGSNAILQRISVNGADDNSFGSNGQVALSAGTFSLLTGLLVQPDGKMILGGSKNAGTGINRYVIFRLNANGSSDNTFGQNGKIENIFPQLASASVDGGWLALQQDGKIIMATHVSDPATPGLGMPLAIIRFKANGEADSNFARNGYRQYMIDSATLYPGGVFTDTPSGEIYAYGLAHYYLKSNAPYELKPYIVKLTGNGTVVSSFGNNGCTIVDAPQFAQQQGGRIYRTIMLRQPDGKFIVAGATDTGATGHIVACRLNANGWLDPTFSNTRILDLPRGVRDMPVAGAIQQNGDLLLGGSTYNKASARPGPSDTSYMFCLRITGRPAPAPQSVNNVPNASGKLVLYPNPSADGHFHLSYQGVTTTGTLQLELYDMTGRLADKRACTLNGRNGEIDFVPAVPLSAGIYWLKAFNNEGIFPALQLVVAH